MTQIPRTNERTNEHTNGRTDKRKGENYIPVGINAGGINISAGLEESTEEATQTRMPMYAQMLKRMSMGSTP